MNRIRWTFVILALISVLVKAAVADEVRGKHLLFQVIRRGQLDLLTGILDRGTPADIRLHDGTTPLMVASQLGDTSMVDLLLSHGADPTAASTQGITALLWGSLNAHVVRLLIDAGADVNAPSSLGNTPLMVAAASPTGNESVRQLLKNGADLYTKNRSGRNALRFACLGGNVNTVRQLLDRARKHAKLDAFLRDAEPALVTAAGMGYRDVVEVLLAAGADPNQVKGSRDALHSALLGGHRPVAKSLIEHGTRLDGTTQPGDTPTALLAAYTEIDDTTIVELLQSHAQDLAAANDRDETALTWAYLRGHEQLVRTLKSAGIPEVEKLAEPERPLRDVNLHAGNQAKLIAESVQKSVDLLQRSSDTFLEVRRNCVSCHHQNLPSIAIAWARDRGFHVRTSSLQRMIDRQVANWQPRISRAYQLDSPFPVAPRFLGYGMWGFAELGYAASELTDAVSWYLANTQQPDGSWKAGIFRPPVGGSDVLATSLALRAMQLYPCEDRQKMEMTIARARRWLIRQSPQTHQDHVFRMFGMAWTGSGPNQLKSEARYLMGQQRDDGGWGQLPGLASDAWATGQTLVVLRTAAGMSPNDPYYRNGVRWLLKHQFQDGSWHVKTRSWPFQPYFESDFPFGRDQWVSAPATAWAVMALTLAIDPVDVVRVLPSQPADTEKVKEAKRDSRMANSTSLPAAAEQNVDFYEDIFPLFERSCLGCHGEEKAEANFAVVSRESLLRGGDSELPAIVPSASKDSPLVRFVGDVDAQVKMPPAEAREKFPAFSRHEVSLLRAWVDQGASWPVEEQDHPRQDQVSGD